MNASRSVPLRLTSFSRRTKLIDDAKGPNPRFRGLIHGTATIVKEEGIRGIYRGLFPVVSVSFSRTIRISFTDVYFYHR